MIALCDGVELAYDDVGSGVPMIMVHGFPHDRTLWAPQLGGLVDRARCLALDLRGFGASPPMAPYSMDRYADDVVCVLDAAGIDRAVVCGLSMGGYVAFAMWRRHPDRVRAFVLAGTRAGADTEESRSARAALRAVAQRDGAAAVAARQVVGMLGKTTREQHPETVLCMHQMLGAASVDGIVGALTAMSERPDSTPTLATIDVPTLIVVGDEDVLTPVHEARALQAGIRRSRLEIIERAGHCSNVERPAAFTHVVSEFLGALTYA